MTTSDLYPYLILVGGSILVATGWLLYQYRKHLQQTRQLIHLNEELAYDLPNFLRQCWPVLSECGFSGLRWSLDWFGTRLEGEQGEQSPQVIEKRFEVQEIRLQLFLYRQRRGLERDYFINAQADHFFLLLRMNLWIKVGTVQGAFDQAAKMNVFLKHDVKNMVQLLRLSNEQLLETGDGHRDAIVETLRAALPTVLERAEHMLRALSDRPGQPAWSPAGGEYQSLNQVLSQAATLYDLDVEIDGTGSVCLDDDSLLSIIDNLLGNYSRQARQDPQRRPLLRIRIYQEGNQVITLIRDVNGKPFPWPERLFEPFWSEYGDGRGIGLYQARQRAMAVGGRLEANAEAGQPLVFSLSLPVEPPAPTRKL